MPSGLLQRRNDRIGKQRAAHGFVGCGEMQALGFVGKHALLHEAVDERRAHLRRLEHLRIELRAEHLARAIDLLAQRVVVFGARDLVTVHARDVRAFVKETAEALNADKTQPRHDDQDQERHHQALVIAEKIEHA